MLPKETVTALGIKHIKGEAPENDYVAKFYLNKITGGGVIACISVYGKKQRVATIPVIS